MDKTTPAHIGTWMSVSREMGGKVLTCQFTCPPPSLPPFLPHLQRPHRLRCFTQPMKCLKDTESVSGHGFLSAGLPGGTRLSLLCVVHALIFRGMECARGVVGPMYNQACSSCGKGLRQSRSLVTAQKHLRRPHTDLDPNVDVCLPHIRAIVL